MKLLPWIFPLLLIAACSPKSETQIGFVKSFSFDVPADTPPDSFNTVIGRAFLLRYNFIDTSMVAGGTIVPANILAYDSASQQTKCVQGYTMFVNEDPKEVLVPDYEGQYFGSPQKIYFFTGSNNHFEVWNNPIVTDGAREDMPEDVTSTFEYKANAECAFLGLKISDPVMVVQVGESERITFYYWSERHHRLEYASDFRLAYSKGGSEPERMEGKIVVMPSGNPYDLRYIVSGDTNYIARLSWRSGRYVETMREEDQSRYMVKLDSMKDVLYPLFTSVRRPTVAKSINKALQLQDFGELVTDESYTRLLKGDDPVSHPDSWEFLVKRINGNVLMVSTVHVKNQVPRLPPVYHQYYFNAHTGDPIRPSTLIRQGSEKKFGQNVVVALGTAMEGYENVPCVDYVPNASQPDKVFMSWDLKSGVMIFETPLCDNIEGGPMPEDSHTYYDMTVATTPISDFDSLRTEYFNDLMSDTGVYIPPDKFARAWHGYIEGKVPVTFVLWPQPESGYGGYLVYDEQGKSVPFRASAWSDTEHEGLTIEELDADNKNVVATFNVRFTGYNLLGTYKRTGESERPFGAVTGTWEK